MIICKICFCDLEVKQHNMRNTKASLTILPLAAIAVIAIGVGISSNVFAQPTTPTVDDPQDGTNAEDQKYVSNDVTDRQTEVSTADNNADNHQDGETNDDHNTAREIPGGDGEQKDSTEK
jgi:cytoskeletal protein RodZ